MISHFHEDGPLKLVVRMKPMDGVHKVPYFALQTPTIKNLAFLFISLIFCRNMRPRLPQSEKILKQHPSPESTLHACFAASHFSEKLNLMELLSPLPLPQTLVQLPCLIRIHDPRRTLEALPKDLPGSTSLSCRKVPSAHINDVRLQSL